MLIDHDSEVDPPAKKLSIRLSRAARNSSQASQRALPTQLMQEVSRRSGYGVRPTNGTAPLRHDRLQLYPGRKQSADCAAVIGLVIEREEISSSAS